MKNYVFQGLKAILYFGLVCTTVLFYKVPAQAADDIPISEEYFPNSRFRAYVAENLDPNYDGILTMAEMENVTEINYIGNNKYKGFPNPPSSEEMMSVKGLEFFTNLHSLTISEADIDKIDVSMFKELIYLDVSYNYLTSLDVSNNTALKELNCRDNCLKQMDVSNNASLEVLDCRDNCLEQMDVSNNTSLEVLNIMSNRVPALDITNNPLLQELYITGNPISSINLRNCPELKKFYCSGYIKQINIGYNPFLCLAYYPRKPILYEFGGRTHIYNGPNGETYELACQENLDIIEVPYNDVGTDRWSYTAIREAFNNKYMIGMGNETFAPEGVVTRSQFVQILYNVEGKPAVTPNNQFIDVLPDQWYSDAIAWAANNQITSGISENEFGTNLPITREQMMTLFYKYGMTKENYRRRMEPSLVEKFKDANQISPWALDAVTWCVSNHVVSGYMSEKGQVHVQTIDPKGIANREQCAQIISNMLTHAIDTTYYNRIN